MATPRAVGHGELEPVAQIIIEVAVPKSSRVGLDLCNFPAGARAVNPLVAVDAEVHGIQSLL
eukprot:6960666-Pyramimonas_sp.AAC.1